MSSGVAEPSLGADAAERNPIDVRGSGSPDGALRPKPPAAEAVSHALNPAGSQPKGVLRWGYFLVLNAIAAVIAVGIFIGVFYADGLDPYMRGTYDWLLAHPGVTSLVAFSPLASSLLVGWGYSQRARKRKAAAARAQAAAAASAAAEGGEPGRAADEAGSAPPAAA